MTQLDENWEKANYIVVRAIHNIARFPALIAVGLTIYLLVGINL